MSEWKRLDFFLRNHVKNVESIRERIQVLSSTALVYGQLLPFLLEVLEEKFRMNRRIMVYPKYCRRFILEYIVSQKHRFKIEHRDFFCKTLQPDLENDVVSQLLLRQIVPDSCYHNQFSSFEVSQDYQKLGQSWELTEFSNIKIPPQVEDSKPSRKRKRRSEEESDTKGLEPVEKRQKIDHIRKSVVDSQVKKWNSEAKRKKYKLMIQFFQTNSEGENKLFLTLVKLHLQKHEKLLIFLIRNLIKENKLDFLSFVISSTLKKKILNIKKPTSRQFLEVMENICKHQKSREVIEEIYVPILKKGMNMTQYEFITKTIKFLQPRNDMIQNFLRYFFHEESFEWNSNLVTKLVRTIILMNVPLTDEELVSSLFVRLESIGRRFSNNLEFGMLIKRINENYPHHTKSHRDLFKDIVKTNKTYITKTIEL